METEITCELCEGKMEQCGKDIFQCVSCGNEPIVNMDINTLEFVHISHKQ